MPSAAAAPASGQLVASESRCTRSPQVGQVSEFLKAKACRLCRISDSATLVVALAPNFNVDPRQPSDPSDSSACTGLEIKRSIPTPPFALGSSSSEAAQKHYPLLPRVCRTYSTDFASMSLGHLPSASMHQTPVKHDVKQMLQAPHTPWSPPDT